MMDNSCQIQRWLVVAFLLIQPHVPAYAALANDQSTEATAILVSGNLIGDKEVQFSPIQRIHSAPSHTKEDGRYVLRLYKTDGRLVENKFTPTVIAGVVEPQSAFFLILPDPGPLAGIEVRLDDMVLQSRERPGLPIQKRAIHNLFSIKDNEAVLKESTAGLDVQWDATVHPWLNLVFRATNGQRQALRLQATGGALLIPVDELPKGTGSWEISMSDGLNAMSKVIERK